MSLLWRGIKERGKIMNNILIIIGLLLLFSPVILSIVAMVSWVIYMVIRDLIMNGDWEDIFGLTLVAVVIAGVICLALGMRG